ncbi:MAG: hypothetical protein AAFU56_04460 [Pseudomonadota bacterium]
MRRFASRRPVWSFGYSGTPTHVEVKPALNSNTGSFPSDAAVDGLGIIKLPDFVVSDAVQKGDLVPVLPDAAFRE